jgi:hypothetical protein
VVLLVLVLPAACCIQLLFRVVLLPLQHAAAALLNEKHALEHALEHVQTQKLMLSILVI